MSSQILECRGESSPKDSREVSESTPSVIASEAKQSTESNPHATAESRADSESLSGGVYLHRDKNQIARSANLKGVVGERGLSRGEGATSPNLQVWISPAASSSPSPLDEKEKEILSTHRILEAKAGDSEKLDSESETLKIQEAKAGDSEKRGLESKNSESAPSVIVSQALQSIESKTMDCHDSARAESRNGDRLDSKAVDCRALPSPTSGGNTIPPA